MEAQTTAPHQAETEGLPSVGLIWGRIWGWMLCYSHRERGFLTVLETGGQCSHWPGAILGLKDSAWPSEHLKAPHLEDAEDQNDCRGGTEKASCRREIEKFHRISVLIRQF